MGKTKLLVELDDTLLAEIDRIRGRVSLPYMIVLLAKFGLATMKIIDKRSLPRT